MSSTNTECNQCNEPCDVCNGNLTDAQCVENTTETLSCLGIIPGDTLDSILQKLDSVCQSTSESILGISNVFNYLSVGINQDGSVFIYDNRTSTVSPIQTICDADCITDIETQLTSIAATISNLTSTILDTVNNNLSSLTNLEAYVQSVLNLPYEVTTDGNGNYQLEDSSGQVLGESWSTSSSQTNVVNSGDTLDISYIKSLTSIYPHTAVPNGNQSFARVLTFSSSQIAAMEFANITVKYNVSLEDTTSPLTDSSFGTLFKTLGNSTLSNINVFPWRTGTQSTSVVESESIRLVGYVKYANSEILYIDHVEDILATPLGSTGTFTVTLI